MVQCIADSFDWFVMSGEGHSESGDNTNCIFATTFDDFFGSHDQPIIFHRNFTKLNVPIACKFMSANLNWSADHVRLFRALAFRAAFFRANAISKPFLPAWRPHWSRWSNTPWYLVASGELHKSASIWTQRASEDTHPCRSCFCRGIHPSICVPRAPPMSGRRWQDSVWNCHQASVHRELTDKHPVLPFRFLENGILAKGQTRHLNQILLTYVPRIESPVSQPDRLPQAAVNASTVCFSSRRQIQCPLSPGNMPPRQADREA